MTRATRAAFGLSRLGYAGFSEVKSLSPSLFSGG